MDKLLIVIGLVVTLVVVIKLVLALQTQKQLGKVAPDISGFLGHSPAPDERLLVYLHSQHCSACKPMTPLIKSLRETHDNVLSINITEQPQLARDLGVMVTPTVVIIEANRIGTIRTGTLNQKQLDRLLQPAIPHA